MYNYDLALVIFLFKTRLLFKVKLKCLGDNGSYVGYNAIGITHKAVLGQLI